MFRRRAFTLIELLVVIVIIGILATVVVVNVISAQNKAKDAKVRSDMATVQTAASLYYNENGNYSNLNCSYSGSPVVTTPASTLMCDSASLGSDTNIVSIINAAKDIKSTLNNTDGLTVIGGSTTYQSFAKLPSTLGTNSTQSINVSDSTGMTQGNSFNFGMLAYWDLDEASSTTNPADSSSNNNNYPLKAVSSDPVVTRDANKYLNARTIPNGLATSNLAFLAAPLTLTMNSGFTISHWIKTASSEGQAYTVWNASSGSGYRFGISNGKVSFLVGDPSGHIEQSNGISNDLVNDNTWHLITGVFDRNSQTFKGYEDNKLLASVPIGGNFPNMQTNSPVLGIFNSAAVTPITIDDVRIYNRILTDDEVKSLYSTGP